MPRLSVELVTDEGAFARLEEAWASLHAETPCWSGFQSFAWVSACRAWLGSQRLLVLVVRDAGEPVGIVPTQVGPLGELRFIGEAVSNYQGPVYRAARVHDVVTALADVVDSGRHGVRLVDLRGLRERSPFLTAWSALRLRGWGEPRLVRTAVCPYVDLTAGWDAVWAKKGNSARGQLTRKWKALTRLGRVEFVETADPGAVREALPVLFQLYGQRWAGRRESGGFAGRLRRFHAEAALALAASGHLRLSLLRLDGHIVAFYYGVTAAEGLASYVTAHDDAFSPYSPGSLLLRRLLEAACARGEPEYDFSLGEERYKDEWATGTREVRRVLRWRSGSTAAITGAVRTVASRAWVAARSVPWMRAVKRDGFRRQLLGPPSVEARPDAPGLPAGAGSEWNVYVVSAPAETDGRTSVTSWTYREMLAVLSPRLLDLALERGFRNDTLLVLQDDERLLGIAWRCCPARRQVALGSHDVGAEHDVFYHPVPAPGRTVEEVVRALVPRASPGFAIAVRDGSLPETLAQRLATFAADLRFKPIARRFGVSRVAVRRRTPTRA